MGQIEVLEFLKKQKEPLTRGEIADAMEKTRDNVSYSLKKLLKYSNIKCVELDRFQAKERCGCKKRIKLYYV